MSNAQMDNWKSFEVRFVDGLTMVMLGANEKDIRRSIDTIRDDGRFKDRFGESDVLSVELI